MQALSSIFYTVITLGVDDLERAVKFYRDGLGLPTEGIIGQQFEHGAHRTTLSRCHVVDARRGRSGECYVGLDHVTHASVRAFTSHRQHRRISRLCFWESAINRHYH